MSLKSCLSRLSMIAILASPMSAVAADKLIVECVDADTQIGYKVFQTSDEPTFRAESIKGNIKLPVVDLLVADAGMLAFIAPVSEARQFTLIVNRLDVTDGEYDGQLTDDGFQGHVRCKLP